MKKAISAGGIVTKKENKVIKVCLVKLTPPMSGYVFPKGHIEQDEDTKDTALREVREETGLSDLKIVKYLGLVRRESIENDGTKVMKDIHIYLMLADSYEHGESDEEYAWFTLEEALQALNFREEQDFLNEHSDLIFVHNGTELKIEDIN